MKKLLSVLLLSLTLPFAAAADKFEEGTHYEVISQAAPGKPEVTEYFSFYCPHCANFEPIMQSVEKHLPEGSAFNKVHVDFLRAASPEMQNTLARAYVIAEHQGKAHDLANAFFKHIHRDHKAFSSAADVRELTLSVGVSAETYDKAISSFSVVGAVKKMKKQQDELTEKRVLTSVPTLIVNGKYKIKMENLGSDTEANLQQLIAFLMAK